jgi:hypothetical protein
LKRIVFKLQKIPEENARFTAQKLQFSPFSRSKTENKTQENAKHAKNGVLFLSVSGSQSRFPIVGFKRVFSKSCLLGHSL